MGPVATCLSPERVVAYLASTATAGDLAEIEAHVDGCEQCRLTIAATIRAGRTTTTETEVGTRIGRYVVQALHGAGAMGHVLEARDPELDRAVAIKIVRHHSEDGDARALREGRALARIAHPNVVTVHDVGTWDGGVFLAMELVDGTDMRAFLATPQPAREVIAIFADIADGLAAAHDAGLVHRDIKPENLVVGRDGRVRILDFGLATDHSSGGERSGTPAYMAPEQASGDATPASDQYAFAVTLFEALEGNRPTRTLTFRRTPRWARSTITRALAIDPALRWSAMRQLARALHRGLGRRRTFAIAAGIAVALITGLTAMAVVMHTDSAKCAGLPDEDLGAVHAALASKAGGQLADQAVTKLQDWQRRASMLRTASCRADKTAELRCIDAVTRDVHVIVGALADPNTTLAANALATIDRAADLTACTQAAVADAGNPFAVIGYQNQLVVLTVAEASGNWEAVERDGIRLAAQLDRDSTRSLQARAWTLVGRARMTAHHIGAAREAFEKALLAAETAGDDLQRGEIYLALVGANLEPALRPQARRYLALGRALLAKVGDPAVTWRVGLMEGAIDEDPEHGVAVLRAALAAYAKSNPRDDENTVRLMATLANVLEAAHHLDDAIATLRTAIAIGDRVLGPEHPELVQPLQELAYCLAGVGNQQEAITVARRALAIAEHTHGDVGVSTVRLALELARSEGSLPAALELVDRALPLVASYDGPNSPLVGNVYQLRGILRSQTGHDAEAVDDFLHTLAIMRGYLAPDSPDFIDLFEYLGRGQRTLGRTDDAVRSFREAREIRGRQLDHKPTDDVAIETALGGTLVDADRIAEGMPHLEKALALSRLGDDREAVAFAEVEVAKALLKRDPARARTLLRDAKAIYAEQDAPERERLAGWNDSVDALLK